MTNSKKSDSLDLKKEPLTKIEMTLPIHNCTIGYGNTVKITIAGRSNDVEGPFTITADERAEAEHRVSIKWSEPKEEVE